jgi:hypothetical protein
MHSTTDATQSLTRLFQRQPVVDLPQLCEALETRSRMTVFRRLSALGYRSSYSHAGRYYTLRELPHFDADGLWQHAGILFSRDGTLRATVARLVEEAEAGQRYRELECRLQLRVYAPLTSLVVDRRIDRRPVQGEFLYVSADPARATVQVERRVSLDAAAAPPRRPVTLAPALVIEVLLEIIHGADLRIDALAVAARMTARGLTVTVDQVEEVCRQHAVEKKTAPSPSPRSRP